MNELEEFSCIDYDKVCDNVTRADSICIHLENCKQVKLYVIEKKEKLDPYSQELREAENQIDMTISYLSVCKAIKCEKMIVTGQLTQSLVRTDRRRLNYIYSYRTLRQKGDPDIKEKIAKYVYENKKRLITIIIKF